MNIFRILNCYSHIVFRDTTPSTFMGLTFAVGTMHGVSERTPDATYVYRCHFRRFYMGESLHYEGQTRISEEAGVDSSSSGCPYLTRGSVFISLCY